MMSSGLLRGLTVVDMTVNVPGPFCSTILADLGARVIKVEPPSGDPLRQSPGMWSGINRGKRSILLNLKTDEGREVLRRLARGSDVVLEGWRPGVAARLGADYEALSAGNPGLVYCSISGFGQEGPWCDRPAHDVNFAALAGHLSAQMQISERPWLPPILISDLASGLYAAVAVLAAVVGRHATGTGRYIDLSMADSTLALLAPEIGRLGTDEAAGRPNVTFIPHYGLFQCSDGRWFSLGIVDEDHFWRRFCEASGLGDMAGLTFAERVERGESLTRAVQEAFLSRTAREWEEALAAADVPAARVTSLADLVDSLHFRSRGMFVDMGLQRFLAQPFRVSGEPVGPVDGPPGPGEHTEALLTELGYDSGQIAGMTREGAFGHVGAGAGR